MFVFPSSLIPLSCTLKVLNHGQYVNRVGVKTFSCPRRKITDWSCDSYSPPLLLLITPSTTVTLNFTKRLRFTEHDRHLFVWSHTVRLYSVCLELVIILKTFRFTFIPVNSGVLVRRFVGSLLRRITSFGKPSSEPSRRISPQLSRSVSGLTDTLAPQGRRKILTPINRKFFIFIF